MIFSQGSARYGSDWAPDRFFSETQSQVSRTFLQVERCSMTSGTDRFRRIENNNIYPFCFNRGKQPMQRVQSFRLQYCKYFT